MRRQLERGRRDFGQCRTTDTEGSRSPTSRKSQVKMPLALPVWLLRNWAYEELVALGKQSGSRMRQLECSDSHCMTPSHWGWHSCCRRCKKPPTARAVRVEAPVSNLTERRFTSPSASCRTAGSCATRPSDADSPPLQALSMAHFTGAMQRYDCVDSTLWSGIVAKSCP